MVTTGTSTMSFEVVDRIDLEYLALALIVSSTVFRFM